MQFLDKMTRFTAAVALTGSLVTIPAYAQRGNDRFGSDVVNRVNQELAGGRQDGRRGRNNGEGRRGDRRLGAMVSAAAGEMISMAIAVGGATLFQPASAEISAAVVGAVTFAVAGAEIFVAADVVIFVAANADVASTEDLTAGSIAAFARGVGKGLIGASTAGQTVASIADLTGVSIGAGLLRFAGSGTVGGLTTASMVTAPIAASVAITARVLCAHSVATFRPTVSVAFTASARIP